MIEIWKLSIVSQNSKNLSKKYIYLQTNLPRQSKHKVAKVYLIISIYIKYCSKKFQLEQPW